MRQPVKSIELEAVITRADGTVEPQGIVASYYSNPVRRLLAKLRGVGKVKTCA